MSYSLATSRPSTAQTVRTTLIVTVVLIVIVGAVTGVIMKLLDDNDRRNDAARAERRAFVASTHQFMSGAAAKVDPSAKVIFESWNHAGVDDPANPATAKVAFGDLYRVCDFTDKYGMLCSADGAPTAEVLD